MTIALEYIAPDDWYAVEQMRTVLQSLVLDTGGQSVGIRFGIAAVSFTASTNSANVAVTHGLGRTPIGVLATPQASPGFGNIPSPNPFSLGATTFTLNAEVKTAFSGSVNVFWAVIG